MLSFDVENHKFNYRTAGVVIHNNRILFQQAVGEDYWFLPGGRVELFETAESALHREMNEEYGVQTMESKLVWIVENFFELDNKGFHEISLYFLVTLPDDSLLVAHEDEFVGAESGYINKWIPIKELGEYNIRPDFLSSELGKVESGSVNHIVHRDIKN